MSEDMDESMGSLRRMITRMSAEKMGLRWVENPQTGATALLPETVADVDAWEKMSVAMHDAQRDSRITVESLTPGPRDPDGGGGNPAGRFTLRRV